MQDLSSFFGQQERRKGEDLADKGLVSISGSSDTGVNAFVKDSSGARVNLTADEVAAPALTAKCSCPQARKGDLCKHVWAVLLKLEQTGSDFLEGKVEVLTQEQASSTADVARQAKAEEFKAQQKQKLKDRNKEIREQKKRDKRGPQFSYPAMVQESLDYFSAQGFPLDVLDMTSLQNARKLLSRVFHPDKGGTHDEILELNLHYDRLEAYLN